MCQGEKKRKSRRVSYPFFLFSPHGEKRGSEEVMRQTDVKSSLINYSLCLLGREQGLNFSEKALDWEKLSTSKGNHNGTGG